MVNVPSKEAIDFIRRAMRNCEDMIKVATGIEDIRLTSYLSTDGDDKSPVMMMHLIADKMGMKYSDYANKCRETNFIELRRVAIMCLFEFYPAITYRRVAELIRGEYDYEGVISHHKKAMAFIKNRDELFCTVYDRIYKEVEAWMKS